MDEETKLHSMSREYSFACMVISVSKIVHMAAVSRTIGELQQLGKWGRRHMVTSFMVVLFERRV